MASKEELLLEEIADQLASPPTIDLSELITALRLLPSPPTADEIAVAIQARLKFPAIPKPEDIRPALDKVAEALLATQSRVSEIPKMAFGNGVTIKNKTDNPVPVTGVITDTVTTSVQTREQRLDYDTRVDSSPVYLGEAAPGTATSASAWVVKKFTYDATNRVTRIQVQEDISWDSRTGGW